MGIPEGVDQRAEKEITGCQSAGQTGAEVIGLVLKGSGGQRTVLRPERQISAQSKQE